MLLTLQEAVDEIDGFRLRAYKHSMSHPSILLSPTSVGGEKAFELIGEVCNRPNEDNYWDNIWLEGKFVPYVVGKQLNSILDIPIMDWFYSPWIEKEEHKICILV